MMKASLICATSLDGFIQADNSHSLDWSSRADKNWFANETKRSGVVIMGSTTFSSFNGSILKDRYNVVMTRRPESFSEFEQDKVWATALTPVEILEKLEQKGFTSADLIGGSVANRLFLEANCIEDIWLSITPYYFGAGIPLFDGTPKVELNLIETRPLGTEEILVHLRIRSKSQ
ncbi:MAG: dihydrofolate reductase family protein [Candidatus Saccharimonadia bacterium]